MAADLSDGGFLQDPESPHYRLASAAPLETLANIPVLGLLGEPGMGKTTALSHEFERAASTETSDRLLRVDLTAVTDVEVRQRIFRSKALKAWQKGRGHLYYFIDGFDTCLQLVKPLVAILLEGLKALPRERLSLRLACRTADC